jgi:hypothetical protein
VRERFQVTGGTATVAGQCPQRLDFTDHLARSVDVDRRQTQAAVPVQFGQHAPGGQHDERACLAVMTVADQDFSESFDHRLHQYLVDHHVGTVAGNRCADASSGGG